MRVPWAQSASTACNAILSVDTRASPLYPCSRPRPTPSTSLLLFWLYLPGLHSLVVPTAAPRSARLGTGAAEPAPVHNTAVNSMTRTSRRASQGRHPAPPIIAAAQPSRRPAVLPPPWSRVTMPATCAGTCQACMLPVTYEMPPREGFILPDTLVRCKVHAARGAIILVHAARIAALRAFWTYWLPTETNFSPQNFKPRA